MNPNVQPIQNHVAQATARLCEQYKNSPRLVGLLQALVLEIQNLELAIFGLDAGRQLKNAVGAQLDAIGTLVGVPRAGMSDAIYLSLILGTIAEDNSDGTAEVLLRIVSTLWGTTSVFQRTPISPTEQLSPGRGNVGFALGSPTAAPASWSLLQAVLQNSIGAGVGLAFLSTYNASGAFACAGPQSFIGGFSDTSGNGGAPLGGTYYTNAGV